ncbi:hypothetical protein HBI56_151270 [Parastagonospora nodorum]|uniref:Uncharacterized protein n=2 Tax=Phaeosphaeria nodorum (strain SN15 / ATCC MYA-4574 / FGSC 10173) TaxID=321614 RepID=A0A7U2FJG4_PHANO|nr:hypothetical protein HBH56_183250 [Parastagonospora nodorum]QRD04151.1 hypothetical protein JI435_128850 [Parastagonospora nodorum SN15]KAH3926094.1 hypothetical protein HBH54_172400 [Parastagonospora nodorum]KAH3944933.1 hypothetical protein HBH53_152520 [Parastagonospora nodorum]KAH3962428.1 hypothetical protein HBH52_223900 [Parastagonospora nodorum]
MRFIETITIALGVLASTASSAPTGQARDLTGLMEREAQGTRDAQFESPATGSGIIIDGIDQPQAQSPPFVEARDAQSGRDDPPPADPTPGLKARDAQSGRADPPPADPTPGLKARNPRGGGIIPPTEA